jgi:hypothetical protein
MIRNYFLINLILLVIIGFLWTKFYKVYSHTFDIPSETAGKQIQKETAQGSSEEMAPDATRFQIISNMDLFRPSRTPYKEEVKQQEAPRIPPRLFGTIILGSEKTAILEDPNTKLTRMYHLNESIGGYVVSDILEDKIVLSWNGEKSEVRLREEKKGLPPVKPMVMPQPPQPQQPQPQMPPQQQQIQPRMPTPPAQSQAPSRRPVPRRVPRDRPGQYDPGQ